MTTVTVITRCRPVLPTELHLKRGKIDCNEIENTVRIQSQHSQTTDKLFTFDSVMPETALQEDVFERVSPMLDQALSGIHSTIFCYGNSGSGKTYTLEGLDYFVNEKNGTVKPNFNTPKQQHGILLRTMEALFDRIYSKMHPNSASSSPSSATAGAGIGGDDDDAIQFRVRVSFVQLYNEKLTDLITKRENLKLRWTSHNTYSVDGLTRSQCESADQVRELFFIAAKNKTMGSHLMNQQSSRSHCIYTFYLEQWSLDSPENVIRSELSLVDLAGSEKLALLAEGGNASAQLLRESIDINCSLLALGKVITALALRAEGKLSSQQALQHVPYRESKLTKLLQHALGGNAVATMIACITPLDSYLDETTSTLMYAGRARNIRNDPRVNEDPRAVLIRQLREENSLLKAELSQYRQFVLDGNSEMSAGIASLLQKGNNSNNNKQIQQQRRPDSSGSTSSSSSIEDPASLAEKLLSSCAMLKDVVGVNGKLRDAFDSMHMLKKKAERHEAELEAENLALRERIDMLESIALKEDDDDDQLLPQNHQDEGESRSGSTSNYNNNNNSSDDYSRKQQQLSSASSSASSSPTVPSRQQHASSAPVTSSSSSYNNNNNSSKLLPVGGFNFNNNIHATSSQQQQQQQQGVKYSSSPMFSGSSGNNNDYVQQQQQQQLDPLMMKSTQYNRLNSSLTDRLTPQRPSHNNSSGSFSNNNNVRKKSSSSSGYGNNNKINIQKQQLREYAQKYRRPDWMSGGGGGGGNGAQVGSYEKYYGAARQKQKERAPPGIDQTINDLTRNLPEATKNVLPQSTQVKNHFGALSFGGTEDQVLDMEERRRQRQQKMKDLQERHRLLQAGGSSAAAAAAVVMSSSSSSESSMVMMQQQSSSTPQQQQQPSSYSSYSSSSSSSSSANYLNTSSSGGGGGGGGSGNYNNSSSSYNNHNPNNYNNNNYSYTPSSTNYSPASVSSHNNNNPSSSSLRALPQQQQPSQSSSSSSSYQYLGNSSAQLGGNFPSLQQRHALMQQQQQTPQTSNHQGFLAAASNLVSSSSSSSSPSPMKNNYNTPRQQQQNSTGGASSSSTFKYLSSNDLKTAFSDEQLAILKQRAAALSPKSQQEQQLDNSSSIPQRGSAMKI